MKRGSWAKLPYLGPHHQGDRTPPVKRKPAASERELSVEERLQEKLEDRRLRQDWRKRQPVVIK